MTRQVAIDAGQTGMKVRVIGDATHDELFPGVLTDRPVLPQIADVVRAIEARDGHADIVTAGVSGLTEAEADASALAALLPGSDRRIVLAHDSVTSYLGAVGSGNGAVVAAGTGVVTLGVGPRGVARVDGWGNVMGDAGSGFWIGREALQSVMRAYDGRGAETALTAEVAEHWPDLPGAYLRLQSEPDWVRTVASFARAVAELSATDAVAADISRRAAAELAASVLASLRRSQQDPAAHCAVAAVGGVFGSPLLHDEFVRIVAEAWPSAHLITPLGDGRDGAVHLAAIPAEHPLATQLSTTDFPPRSNA